MPETESSLGANLEALQGEPAEDAIEATPLVVEGQLCLRLPLISRTPNFHPQVRVIYRPHKVPVIGGRHSIPGVTR